MLCHERGHKPCNSLGRMNQDLRHQLQTSQRCRSRCPPLPASRRAPSDSGTKGRLRSEPPRKAAPPSPAASQSNQREILDGEQFEVPSVGWMWQAGSTSGSSSSNSGAGATTAAPRNMPSAASTVANLYEDRIKAKKSLGQNFVTDDGVLLDIVAAAAVGPEDLVLEVGPGTGNLTKHLLTRGAWVTAVEKDDTLYGRLRDEYRDEKALTLVHGDALKVGLEQIIRGMVEQEREPGGPAAVAESAATAAGAAAAAAAAPGSSPATGLRPQPASGVEAPSSASTSTVQPSTSCASDGASGGGTGPGASGVGASRGRRGAGRAPRKVKVVANLPYNITKDLMLLLLPLGDVISDLHIMIQHEAAVRLTERTPGGPEWRAANIRTLFYCKPRYRFRISRLKYDPVPGVDGALATFSLLPPSARPAVPSERSFHALVTKGFSERRKKLRNSVQPLYSSQQVEAALGACGLNVDARAQDLTVEEFVALSWQLHRMQLQEGMDLLQEQEQP